MAASSGSQRHDHRKRRLARRRRRPPSLQRTVSAVLLSQQPSSSPLLLSSACSICSVFLIIGAASILSASAAAVLAPPEGGAAASPPRMNLVALSITDGNRGMAITVPKSVDGAAAAAGSGALRSSSGEKVLSSVVSNAAYESRINDRIASSFCADVPCACYRRSAEKLKPSSPKPSIFASSSSSSLASSESAASPSAAFPAVSIECHTATQARKALRAIRRSVNMTQGHTSMHTDDTPVSHSPQQQQQVNHTLANRNATHKDDIIAGESRPAKIEVDYGLSAPQVDGNAFSCVSCLLKGVVALDDIFTLSSVNLSSNSITTVLSDAANFAAHSQDGNAALDGFSDGDQRHRLKDNDSSYHASEYKTLPDYRIDIIKNSAGSKPDESMPSPGSRQGESTHPLLLLDLSNNRISSLEFTKAFVNLRWLSVASNRLTALGGNTAYRLGLPHLEVLNLANNAVESIAFEAFAELVSLRFLSMAGNRLTQLSHGWFQSLRSLVYLSFSHNKLQTLDNLVLAPAGGRLRTLDLAHNQLEHIGRLGLRSLNVLERLDLSHNNLSSLPSDLLDRLVRHSASSLTYLDLSFNPLRSLGRKAGEQQGEGSSPSSDTSGWRETGSNAPISWLPSSWSLSSWPWRIASATQTSPSLELPMFGKLSKQNVKNFSVQKFGSFINAAPIASPTPLTVVARGLRHLHKISANDTADLHRTVSLDLSGSALLETITPDAFAGLFHLRNLNLSYCGLKTLSRGLFEPLVQLDSLSLRGNMWRCDCSLWWLLEFLIDRPQLRLDKPADTRCATVNDAAVARELNIVLGRRKRQINKRQFFYLKPELDRLANNESINGGYSNNVSSFSVNSNGHLHRKRLSPSSSISLHAYRDSAKLGRKKIISKVDPTVNRGSRVRWRQRRSQFLGSDPVEPGAGSTKQDGQESRLPLLDVLDRYVHCESATVVGYSRSPYMTQLGSPVVLRCDAYGSPPPSFVWYRRQRAYARGDFILIDTCHSVKCKSLATTDSDTSWADSEFPSLVFHRFKSQAKRSAMSFQPEHAGKTEDRVSTSVPFVVISNSQQKEGSSFYEFQSSVTASNPTDVNAQPGFTDVNRGNTTPSCAGCRLARWVCDQQHRLLTGREVTAGKESQRRGRAIQRRRRRKRYSFEGAGRCKGSGASDMRSCSPTADKQACFNRVDADRVDGVCCSGLRHFKAAIGICFASAASNVALSCIHKVNQIALDGRSAPVQVQSSHADEQRESRDSDPDTDWDQNHDFRDRHFGFKMAQESDAENFRYQQQQQKRLQNCVTQWASCRSRPHDEASLISGSVPADGQNCSMMPVDGNSNKNPCTTEDQKQNFPDRYSKSKCTDIAITCVLSVLVSTERLLEPKLDNAFCADSEHRVCAKDGFLYISSAVREDAGYYTCRVSNVLQTQQVSIHLTLDYGFLTDVKIYSILAGFGTCVLLILAAFIGVGVEKVLERFGVMCPCNGVGSTQRQNVIKILEQIEGYRKQNLERLRENYNWQVARIKENCILQIDRIKDSYIAEQTGRIRDYGSTQIGAIKDNYFGQVQRVRDYGNAQMDWLRENYVFQRNRIHKFSKHQLIRLRENYKLQQKHLNKVLETLPNLESCRKGCPTNFGFYSETDLRELGSFGVMMLDSAPPAPESILNDFPAFDEFSLPDIRTLASQDGEGSIGALSQDSGSIFSGSSAELARPCPYRVYPVIDDVIRERLLPLAPHIAVVLAGPHCDDDLRLGVPVAASVVGRRGYHRRSHSAPLGRGAGPQTDSLLLKPTGFQRLPGRRWLICYHSAMRSVVGRELSKLLDERQNDQYRHLPPGAHYRVFNQGAINCNEQGFCRELGDGSTRRDVDLPCCSATVAKSNTRSIRADEKRCAGFVDCSKLDSGHQSTAATGAYLFKADGFNDTASVDACAPEVRLTASPVIPDFIAATSDFSTGIGCSGHMCSQSESPVSEVLACSSSNQRADKSLLLSQDSISVSSPTPSLALQAKQELPCSSSLLRCGLLSKEDGVVSAVSGDRDTAELNSRHKCRQDKHCQDECRQEMELRDFKQTLSESQTNTLPAEDIDSEAVVAVDVASNIIDQVRACQKTRLMKNNLYF